MGEPGKCYGCGKPSTELTCDECWSDLLDEDAAEPEAELPDCIVLGED